METLECSYNPLSESLKELKKAEMLIILPANERTCSDMITLNGIEVSSYEVAASVVKSHATLDVTVIDNSPGTTGADESEIIHDIYYRDHQHYAAIVLRSTKNGRISSKTDDLLNKMDELHMRMSGRCIPTIESDLILSPNYFERGGEKNKAIFRKGTSCVPLNLEMTAIELMSLMGFIAKNDFSASPSFARGVKKLAAVKGYDDFEATYHMYEACVYAADVNEILSPTDTRLC